MSRKTLLAILTVLVAVGLGLVAGRVTAQAPSPTGTTWPYSASLADAAGQPVADGAYDFVFTLYAVEKDGQALWSEMQPGIYVKGGEVNASLGAIVPLPVKIEAPAGYWLEVSVRGPNDKTFTLLNPRQSLSAAPSAEKALDCPHSHFTDSWSGYNPEYGLLLDNGSTGDGLRAYSRGTVWNYAAVFGANVATSGYGTGVYGYSDYGVGVYANSALGDGLEATTTSTTKSAVYAHATDSNGVWAVSENKLGVRGASTNAFGVEAVGGGDDEYLDSIGDLLLGGNRGEIFSFGDVLEIFSNGYVVIDLDNDDNGANQFEIWNGNELMVFKVDEAGNSTATGTKSASVNTDSYGGRLLYAMESPEVWFEDIGSARLENGAVTVPFEAIFAETVNLKSEYHVFVTPLCEEAVLLFVSEKTAQGFTVKGVTLDNQPSSCALDYRVVAKRLGYESMRLAPLDTKANSRSQATD